MNRFVLTALIAIFVSSCSTTQGIVKATNPNAKFIDVTGSIDNSLTYTVKVEYRATADLEQCKNYHLTLGRDIAQKYEVSYSPEIKGSSHFIRVPLQELEANTMCLWKPVMMFVCANSSIEKPGSCSSAFSFRGMQDVDPITYMECDESGFCFNSKRNLQSGVISDFNRSYELNLSRK